MPSGTDNGDDIRGFIISREESNLSPLAMPSSQSRGRRRPEEPCPVRTEFQRDRDRILHSKAFRRLSHKTQVFIAPEGDHFRTRLTHTLEVAQVARTISRALSLNEDLTEAIALGHDIGHTPFGHMGERILDSLMREWNIKDGFRHQIQSVRIAQELANNGKGLNLTYETLDGIGNHSKGLGDYDLTDDCTPATIEGKVVKIADRIAYVNHDLEDAYRAGLVGKDDLPTLFVGRLGDTTRDRINSIVLDIITQSRQSGNLTVSAEVAESINRLKDFLFARVYDHPKVISEGGRIRSVIEGIFRKLYEDREISQKYIGKWIDDDEKRRRAAADYISGCTDRYAMMIFERMYMPGFWRLEF